MSFTAPQVNVDTTFGLQLFAFDPVGCGTVYPIDLIVRDTAGNNDPVVVLEYEEVAQAISGTAPSGDVEVESPATIDLDASQSSDPDGDAITFGWQVNNAGLTSGSTVFNPTGATATLTALFGTRGPVSVTVTVSDDKGAQASKSQIFVFVEPPEGSQIIYPIWGVGPLGDGSALQTTVIIDNLSEQDAEDVRID